MFERVGDAVLVCENEGVGECDPDTDPTAETEREFDRVWLIELDREMLGE